MGILSRMGLHPPGKIPGPTPGSGKSHTPITQSKTPREGRSEIPRVGLRCWIGDGRAEDVAVAEGCRAIAIRRWLCYRSAGEQGLAIGINRRAVGGIPHIVPDAYNHIIGRRSIVIVA